MVKEYDKLIDTAHKKLVDVEASSGIANTKDEKDKDGLTPFDRQRIELGRLTIEYEKNIDTVTNHVNYVDIAYSESLMTKEIQQYEQQIPLFEVRQKDKARQILRLRLLTGYSIVRRYTLHTADCKP